MLLSNGEVTCDVTQ